MNEEKRRNGANSLYARSLYHAMNQIGINEQLVDSLAMAWRSGYDMAMKDICNAYGIGMNEAFKRIDVEIEGGGQE